MVAQALHDNAFDVPYKSLHEILHRPNLENESTLQIRWKPSICGNCIIPITYASFWEAWRRTIIVSGMRDTALRPYALRVGVGQNLDGAVPYSMNPVGQLLTPLRQFISGTS